MSENKDEELKEFEFPRAIESRKAADKVIRLRNKKKEPPITKYLEEIKTKIINASKRGLCKVEYSMEYSTGDMSDRIGEYLESLGYEVTIKYSEFFLWIIIEF